MTRCPTWDVGTVLDVNEVSTHVLVTPRCIAGEVSDIVPFVVRGPGELHCVDLRAASECCSAWVVETGADIGLLACAQR